jgi:hypothetical protein
MEDKDAAWGYRARIEQTGGRTVKTAVVRNGMVSRGRIVPLNGSAADYGSRDGNVIG